MAIATYLIYTVIALASVAFYFIRKRMNYWQQRGIPCDEPSLLNGNFQGAMKTRTLGSCTRQVYEKFKGTGPFCGFYAFQRPAALLLDTALVKNVLIKDFSNFMDRGLYSNDKDDPLSGHLFMADGNKWKNLRHKLSPTFTSGKMKAMYPNVLNVAERFVQVFEEMAKQNSNVVEIRELLARFTTDIIGKCAFGIDCNSLKDPEAEFRVMGKKSLRERRHGKLGIAFIQAFPNLARKMHMCVFPQHITDFFVRIVRETVQYREDHNIKANDFLSILIDLKNNKEPGDVHLSIEQMAAQAFVFFVGGFETSSSTMGLTLYELAQHQGIQQRLRDEINEGFARDNSMTYETLHKMNYMGQVISETLRKYPILPHLSRQALNDYVVPGHPKYVIPKGMQVLIPIFGIHHDPEIYPEPEKFNPDRFDMQQEEKRDSVEFLAFGDGPRNCIGMRFGLMQARVGLAYLLRNFKFSVCEQTEVPFEWNVKSFLLNAKNGIFLQVERI